MYRYFTEKFKFLPIGNYNIRTFILLRKTIQIVNIKYYTNINFDSWYQFTTKLNWCVGTFIPT